MTFFASLALVFVLIVRPQEIWPALAALHLLDVFTAACAIGLVYDIAMKREQHLYSPQLPFLAGFIVCCYLMTALSLGVGRGMAIGTNRALIPATFMLAVMFGVRTLSRLQTMVWLLLLLAAVVSSVAVHQGQQPAQCMERHIDDEGLSVVDTETANGAACGDWGDCAEEGKFDVEWACERLGLFNTVTVQRRVRWRGQLDDPNELSVFIGAVIPLLFAVGLPVTSGAANRTRKRQMWLGIIAAIMIAIGLYAVILSQSRGGQLVLATVFGIYFISRFGKKGLLFGALFALPVLLLGGRSTSEADASSSERIELLYEGINLVMAHPFRGVGVDQFADQVNSPLHLTAHNSYLLTAAELGFPGLFCWSGIVWTSLKIPFRALGSPTLPVQIRAIAMGLVVSFSGIMVGIFFLSFTYKQLLFVWFGISAAFYGIMRNADPNLEVKIGWKDLVLIGALDALVIAGIFAYTRAHVGGG